MRKVAFILNPISGRGEKKEILECIDGMLGKYPDYRIVCLDKLTYAGNLSTLAPVMDNPNFRFVKESITDREAVYKLFEEEHPDMVVNFAAESHVDRSIENPEVFLDTNCSGLVLFRYALGEFPDVNDLWK